MKNKQMIWMPVAALLVLALVLARPSAVRADGPIRVTSSTAALDFPNTVTFTATLENAASLSSITFEYGTAQSTCGEVIAKAFPKFQPGDTVQVQWTWDMRQAGSLPPGTTIWWRWRLEAKDGTETLSDQQTVIWLDSTHNWQTISHGMLRLHWYSLSQSFAQGMLDAAQGGLDFNERQSGLKADAPIDIYLYRSYADMRGAVLYEPSWTGGLAFPEHNIVIMGLPDQQSDWEHRAIVHELTHVLVGHLTFTCLGSVPTWLNEGLAVYSEGDMDPQDAAQLQDAIRQDSLLSVRSLSAGFSEVSDKAQLSYSESYSIVKYLIEKYGQQKMTALLEALRNGESVDQALEKVYGFNVEGLEEEWRQAIGAKPRQAAQPTAQPTPTYVPTYVPISGGQIAVTLTPYAIPTSSFGTQIPQGTGYGPPLALTLLLVGFCCIFGVLIAVVILGVIVRRAPKQAGKNE